jgi:tripartite-type tricarboxylate transporter receptor subunit TctC
MKISKLLATALAVFLSSALAADYPTKPITTIGPFGSGAADVMVRTLAGLMPEYLGQPLVYVSKPGAAGTIAGHMIVQAPPDGYTIGALVSTGAVPEIYRHFRESPYTSADLRPVIRLGSAPYALFVKSNSPWKTLDEFVAAARAKPDGLSYVHAGVGHVYHVLLTAVMKKAGASIKDVGVAGGGQAITMLLGGHVDGAMAATSAGKEHVASGTLRMLAVQHKERFAWAPNVPTFAESGYDFGFAPWYISMFAPAKTPDDIIARLHGAMRKAMADPRYRDTLEKVGLVPDYGSPDDVRSDVRADVRVIGGVLKNLGMYK